ncbi:MAG: hypothetical protein V4574_05130 [Pseudomonadota bacterium]
MEEVVQLSRMCAKCSAALAEDANFCGNCGVRAGSGETGRALDAARNFAVGTATEAGNHAREIMKNPTAQKIAGGAALGAAAATVIPFVTIGLGAVLGAGYVAFKRLTK